MIRVFSARSSFNRPHSLGKCRSRLDDHTSQPPGCRRRCEARRLDRGCRGHIRVRGRFRRHAGGVAGHAGKPGHDPGAEPVDPEHHHDDGSGPGHPGRQPGGSHGTHADPAPGRAGDAGGRGGRPGRGPARQFPDRADRPRPDGPRRGPGAARHHGHDDRCVHAAGARRGAGAHAGHQHDRDAGRADHRGHRGPVLELALDLPHARRGGRGDAVVAPRRVVHPTPGQPGPARSPRRRAVVPGRRDHHFRLYDRCHARLDRSADPGQPGHRPGLPGGFRRGRAAQN